MVMKPSGAFAPRAFAPRALAARRPHDEPFRSHPAADQDLNDIWDYIAPDNLDAADRVLRALETAFQRLADSPALGHYREDLADKRHRFDSVYSYLIVYRWETTPLQIIRVLHGARDVQALIGG
jgi:plasmid stabilization system protein ParE